jgi:hypothetical protein
MGGAETPSSDSEITRFGDICVLTKHEQPSQLGLGMAQGLRQVLDFRFGLNDARQLQGYAHSLCLDAAAPASGANRGGRA